MRPPFTPPVFREWRMSDGYRLRGRVWTAAAPANDNILLYLHGIQSHGGWFEWSASILARSGYTVILPDRRGSGLNDTARGDTPSWQRWIDDLDEIANWAAAEFHATRFDLVGVSWGGKPAVMWAVSNPDRVRRLLLIAPGLFPAVDVGWRARFQIGRALLTDPGREFPIPLNDPALFTDNPAGRRFIADDPLKLTHATARFFWNSRQLDRRLSRLCPNDVRAEIMLLLAERERIIHNALTDKWANRITAGRVVTRTLTGTAHTIEFEAELAPFETLLLDWAAGAR